MVDLLFTRFSAFVQFYHQPSRNENQSTPAVAHDSTWCEVSAKMREHLLGDFVNLYRLSPMSRPLNTSPTALTAVLLNLWSQPWENKILAIGGVSVLKFHHVVADTSVLAVDLSRGYLWIKSGELQF